MADPGHLPDLVEQAGRRRQGNVAEVDAENVAVEEGQGGVDLFEAAEGVGPGGGDVAKEATDVGGRQVARVPLVVVEDGAACPVGVTFDDRLRMARLPGGLAQRIQQAGRLGRLVGRRGRCAVSGLGGRHRDILLTGVIGEVYPGRGQVYRKRKEKRRRVAELLDGGRWGGIGSGVIARGRP
jgi:hypothetical protein